MKEGERDGKVRREEDLKQRRKRLRPGGKAPNVSCTRAHPDAQGRKGKNHHADPSP